METKTIHEKINVRANSVEHGKKLGFEKSHGQLAGKPYRRDFDLWKTSPFVVSNAYYRNY